MKLLLKAKGNRVYPIVQRDEVKEVWIEDGWTHLRVESEGFRIAKCHEGFFLTEQNQH